LSGNFLITAQNVKPVLAVLNKNDSTLAIVDPRI
jgi:hypothetical protein